jgi:Tfp pilus assembly protein PilO
VLLVVISATILPLTGFVRSEFEQRRLTLRELAKLEGLVAAEPDLRKLVSQIDAHPLWQRIYRDSAPGTAAANLQKDFRTLAEAQGISVDTLQPLDPTVEGKFVRLSLRVGFNTTIDHLGQLLAAMEAAPRFVKFENLYVTAPMSQNGSGNAPLVVRGDVLAYFTAEQAP